MNVETTNIGTGQRLRCAIYSRSRSNPRLPVNLGDQVRRCREAAGERGWLIQEEFICQEEGPFGASVYSRDGLTALVESAAVSPRPYDILLVNDWSRLSRDIGDVFQIVKFLKDKGAAVYFVDHNVDSRDPSFHVMLTIFAME